MARKKRGTKKAKKRASRTRKSSPKRRKSRRRAPKRPSAPKRSRAQRVKDNNLLAGFLIRERTREKLRQPKDDPRSVVKFFAEFALVIIIALGLVVYFDPNVNIIPEPLNYLLFAIVFIAIIAVHFHRH